VRSAVCERRGVQTGAAARAGLLWWQQGQSDTVFAAGSTNGLIFFNLVFLAFRSMFVALFTFPSEQKMMMKARCLPQP